MSAGARKVAFVAAAALLVGLALRLDARGRGPADPQPATTPSRPVIERTPAPTPPMSSRRVQAAAKRTALASTSVSEHEPRLAPAVAPREGRAAATAARVFLRAYLPYSYGRGGGDRIRGAAPPLVRALREAPPRVPAAVAPARPRLLSVHAQGATDDRDVLIIAEVDDGRRRYDLRLIVQHGADRWVVTEISG